MVERDPKYDLDDRVVVDDAAVEERESIANDDGPDGAVAEDDPADVEE